MSDIKLLTLRIEGPARGKARPRTVTHKGTTWTYTPDPGEWTENLRALAFQEWGTPLWAGPVGIRLVVRHAIPTSTSSKKRRQALMGTPCTVRPDLNNIMGAVLDGLARTPFGHKMLFAKEDAQIAEVHATKVWDEYHSTEIEVWQREAGEVVAP